LRQKNIYARLAILIAGLSVAFVWAGGALAQREGQTISGRWEIEAAPEGETLRVMLARAVEGGGKDNRHFRLALSELSGLTRGEVFARGGDVRFQLRREAGVFDFTGRFAEGRGAGAFTFTADAGYVERLTREGYGEALRQNLLGFAIGNFAGSPADEFAALGLDRPTPEQLKEMAWHGAGLDFIRELKALGYEPRSVAQLIEMRRHGAGPAFAEELRKLGYERPTLEQLVEMRRHGASVDFIRQLQARGYERPTIDQLIELRKHGAGTAFIDQLKTLGYEGVPLEQLIEMRKHGVSADFIRALRAEGVADASPEALIDVKMFGMPTDLLRRLPARGEAGKSSGDWRAKFYRQGTDRVWVYLRDRTGRVENRSFELTPEEFRGLTEAQAFSAEGAEVRFTITRNGSTLVCTGWFKGGFGAGVFTHAGEANNAARR
jgi:hypothetical protein